MNAWRPDSAWEVRAFSEATKDIYGPALHGRLEKPKTATAAMKMYPYMYPLGFINPQKIYVSVT